MIPTHALICLRKQRRSRKEREEFQVEGPAYEKPGAGQSLVLPGRMDRSSLRFWNPCRLSNSQNQKGPCKPCQFLDLSQKEPPKMSVGYKRQGPAFIVVSYTNGIT